MVEDTEVGLDEIMDPTDGNPLFVTELLASGATEIPSSVQDSILARAAKLSPEARRLLDLVSVIPGEAERSLLESILGSETEAMTECIRQGLLEVSHDTLAFQHELSRRAIEAALSSADRGNLNREVLGELIGWGDPARLVHHAREAHAVDAILEFAPTAARAAMAIDSHREAVAHFRTLEPHLDRIALADRAAIVDDWARSEIFLDNVDALGLLADAIELHRSVGDEVALSRALTFAVRVSEVNGRPDKAEAAAREAVALLEKLPSSANLAFAVSTRAWLAMMRTELADALEYTDEAITIVDQVGDELSMVHALNTKGTVLYLGGDPAGFDLLEESRRRAADSGFRFEQTRALINMAAAALQNLELDRAAELAQSARESAVRYEIPLFVAYGQAQYAEALLWKGGWPAATDAAEGALGSHPHTDLIAGFVLASLQSRQGLKGAKATLERTRVLAEASREIQHLTPVAAVEAEHMWLAGENGEGGIRRLREIHDEGVRLGQRGHLGSLAFWLWKLTGEAGTLVDSVEPYRLIVEGDPVGASAEWSTKGCPYEQAIALWHGDQAAQLQALGILDDLGAAAVAAKLRQELRDRGVSVPRGRARKTKQHRAGLTARQDEVLQLLVEGLSNMEIADRLFLSPRTVEHHVSAVLTKLDASTREEAVAAADRQGLVPTG